MDVDAGAARRGAMCVCGGGGSRIIFSNSRYGRFHCPASRGSSRVVIGKIVVLMVNKRLASVVTMLCLLC